MKVINEPVDDRNRPDHQDRCSLLEYFLNLYKRQLNVPLDSPHQVYLVNPENQGSNYTYEFRVDCKRRVETRRISIEMIGEAGHKTRTSKSTCFKVIYDNLIVIKIPPEQIRDFGEYIDNIKLESRIAQKLEPDIEYVAPGISALMKKIHLIEGSDALSPSELEFAYIDWLKKHPSYQHLLKINGAFVFFMDLSKYTFLSRVIENFHSRALFVEKLQEEITKSHDLLWDIFLFENKYGSENLPICFNVNRIYSDYETEIQLLLNQYGIFFSPYEKQEWFLSHLADKPVVKEDNDMPEDFVNDLNKLLRKIINNNREDVQAYRNAVGHYITKVNFNQNRVQMGVLITNLMHLIAFLKQRKISIRDLKPDNLFVVGDPNKNPLFLTSKEDTALGLIDFETSVDFETNDKTDIPQPLLGGTPSYATPSHFFTNDILKAMTNDLQMVLHMQDTYASIGIIFNIITGETLFNKTRRMLSRVKETAIKAARSNRPLTEAFSESSFIFWNSAYTEFYRQLKRYNNQFESVSVTLDQSSVEYLKSGIKNDILVLKNNIKKLVLSQKLFTKEKSRKYLLESSSTEIKKYLKRWENDQNVPKTNLQLKNRILGMLKKLVGYKEELEERLKLQKQIQMEETPTITSYALIDILFSMVLKTMYKEEWGKLGEAVDNAEPAKYEGETTIAHEQTIVYNS